MKYQQYHVENFFQEINTEEKAREFLWKMKFNGQIFRCSSCGGRKYFTLKSRPEVKKCKSCQQSRATSNGHYF